MILTTTQVRTAAHGGGADPKLSGGLDQMDRVVGELKRRALALRVARLVGQQDIYVKPLPVLLGALRVLAGLTVLGDGRPVFLLDLNQLP